MANLNCDRETTALLVIDPYNDFISEGGKIWDRIKTVAEANNCVPNMLQVLKAARQARLRVFYAMHHRYRPGDYETWQYIAPIQNAAWSRRSFEYGTWGGEIRSEFTPLTSGASHEFNFALVPVCSRMARGLACSRSRVRVDSSNARLCAGCGLPRGG
jgi:nicotinamidase-related amidase